MADGARDTSNDGWRNKLEYSLLAGLRPFWAFVNDHPWLARLFNGWIIDRAVKTVPIRPLALSTMSPYTSWASLSDRGWFTRYLPESDAVDLPAKELVAELFKVPHGAEGRESERSTLLFPCFAQWFTDGFLVTDDKNRAQTHTNHQIDLSPLYGLTPDVTRQLRVVDPPPDRRGRLKSQIVGNAEWAEFLFDAEGKQVGVFDKLPKPAKLPDQLPLDRKRTLFAFGGERANSTLFTAAINTLFLREHNRLCGALGAANPQWDDERVFQTARNINIVLLIKVVVEEYINHISPYWFKLLADPKVCYKADWNRENWIPVEFNLLYRWHSLIPEKATWAGAPIALGSVRFDNGRLLQGGLREAFASASASAAWRMGLFNTSSFLQDVEEKSIEQGRANKLQGYNAYRERMDYPRVTSLDQISGDPKVIEGLKRVYGDDVDTIEYFVGLFAEEIPERSAVPSLIGRMVAADAFSHALTNPLLSPKVYNVDTFTKVGLDTIARTSTLRDILARNEDVPAETYVSMDRRGRYASTADKHSMAYLSLWQKEHNMPQTGQAPSK